MLGKFLTNRPNHTSMEKGVKTNMIMIMNGQGCKLLSSKQHGNKKHDNFPV